MDLAVLGWLAAVQNSRRWEPVQGITLLLKRPASCPCNSSGAGGRVLVYLIDIAWVPII